jgi:hypothetical protein
MLFRELNGLLSEAHPSQLADSNLLTYFIRQRGLSTIQSSGMDVVADVVIIGLAVAET